MLGGIASPTSATLITYCNACEFTGTLEAPGSHQTLVGAILSTSYAEGWVTGCKVDGYITKGGVYTDITDQNFFNFVYSSGAPDNWSTLDPAYEGNYGIEFGGGSGLD